MASEVDWNSMGGSQSPSSNTSGQIKFVKFSPGKGKTIRPIGKAVTFYKFFVRGPHGDRSIVVDPEFKNEASAKLSAHAGQEIKPSLRYAVNVIDREDNQIKILEGGQSIFEHFANWSQGNGGAPPGGANGMDWTISASGEKLLRKYATTPIRSAPLTEDEVHRIKELKEIYSLKEVYKGCPMSELIDRAFGERKERGSSGPEPSAPQPARRPASAPVAATVTVPSDDPINW